MPQWPKVERTSLAQNLRDNGNRRFDWPKLANGVRFTPGSSLISSTIPSPILHSGACFSIHFGGAGPCGTQLPLSTQVQLVECRLDQSLADSEMAQALARTNGLAQAGCAQPVAGCWLLVSWVAFLAPVASRGPTQSIPANTPVT